MVRITNSDNPQKTDFELVGGKFVGDNGETLTEVGGYLVEAKMIEPRLNNGTTIPVGTFTLYNWEADTEYFFTHLPTDPFFGDVIETLVDMDIADPITIRLTTANGQGAEVIDSKGKVYTTKRHTIPMEAKSRTEYMRSLCNIIQEKIDNIK